MVLTNDESFRGEGSNPLLSYSLETTNDKSFSRRRIESASEIEPGLDQNSERIYSNGLIPLADPIRPNRYI